jgi:hypothetical protein
MVLLALAITLGLPIVSLADPPPQGRGHHKHGWYDKQDKKDEKFINGHDARDGRWDGRGPKRNRDRGRDWDRDNDGINDRLEIRRQAYNIGYREGLRAGYEARRRGDRFNFRDHIEYRDAVSGYRDHYGDIDFYRRHFRDGFRQGYEGGYRNRGQRSGAGSVFDDIFGRP